MNKIDTSDFIIPELTQSQMVRIQKGFISFTERPSNRYGLKGEIGSDKDDSRINAFQLFSFFTADIIKEEILFKR